VLLCVTASHKTASFELLERLSTRTSAIAPAIAAHDTCVQGAVVVATCNRFEAYVDMDEPVTAAGAVGVEATLLAIEAATGVTPDEFEGSYRVVAGRAVAEHLFSVASGLESVVVGEGEIAGQVRRALTEARHDRTTSPELERLFQRASEAQRGVKNATALGRAGRSLVRLALDLADSRIADWSALRILLVGTGSYAAATLAALRDHGASDIAVFSPSGRGERFALKHGIQIAETLEDAASADLVITCTSAEHVVTSAALRPGASREPAGAPSGCPVHALAAPEQDRPRQLVIDLGMPRNVDPAVGLIDGVDLLDLETIRLHAPLEELQATDAARRVVQDAAQRFAVVGEHRNVTPAVVALRTRVFGLLDDEIARARSRGDDDGRTEQALRHLVGRLLHTPTARAHELAEQGRADEFTSALAILFDVEPAAERVEPGGESAAG
jgi:glutamyl-tRNA reductase